jgi:hypothetical protein
VSAKPPTSRASTNGTPERSRHACLTASRCPARLPLSTVETYCGASGSSVRVSYQLRKWSR